MIVEEALHYEPSTGFSYNYIEAENLRLKEELKERNYEIESLKQQIQDLEEVIYNYQES